MCENIGARSAAGVGDPGQAVDIVHEPVEPRSPRATDGLHVTHARGRLTPIEYELIMTTTATQAA